MSERSLTMQSIVDAAISQWRRLSAFVCVRARDVATGVDIGIYTPKISPSKLFMG